MKDDNAHAVAPQTSATGRVLGGRYRVGDLIRSGGMGAVYEGEHMATGRRVALKLVHLRGTAVVDIEDRFEREARIASNIQSKHIVQVFDAGRDPALGPFIAMELLKGEDLEERLAQVGPLPARTACEIAFQVARGLEKAHASNVAHRDLKPGNIFLIESDEDDFLAKVLDFGIAKLVDGGGEASAKLTRAGTALGTPQYMSPEQARGQLDIDARTDVYSLGAVLYEMIVGRGHVPELPNYNQLVIHIATERAPRVAASVPAIDPRIDRLVADMLVGDRRDRVQTMRTVRERLGQILGNAPRYGSIADGSGSSGAFAVGRASSSVEFSSARMLAAAPAPEAAADEPDSEEVHFFERESAAPAAGPGEARGSDRPPPSADVAPDSMAGEEVVLFERASLRLPVADRADSRLVELGDSPRLVDRTSSGAHVIDDARAGASRLASVGDVELEAPDPTEVAAGPPLFAVPTSPSIGRRKSRRTLLAVALLTGAFVALGSVRWVRSDGAFRSSASRTTSETALVPGVADNSPLGLPQVALDASAGTPPAAPARNP